MYAEHPVFNNLNDENVKIWRWMDFTKFISLLDNSSLFFSRVDKLDDPFEGSYPKTNIEYRVRKFKQLIETSHTISKGNWQENFSEFLKKLTSHVLVNCWHISEYESAALWKLYIKGNEGIAVQSTLGRLKKCIVDKENDVFIGKVNYINYESDRIPDHNLFYPFIYKRESFHYEQELRAVIFKFGYEIKDDGELNMAQFGMPAYENGIFVPVDINTLIEKIYLSPSSKAWLFELTNSICNKYNLDKKILQSSLDTNPLY